MLNVRSRVGPFQVFVRGLIILQLLYSSMYPFKLKNTIRTLVKGVPPKKYIYIRKP